MNRNITELIRILFYQRTVGSPLIGICCLAVMLCTACVSTEPPDQPSSAPVNMSLVEPGTITEAELDDQLRRFSDRFTTRMSVAIDTVRGMDVTSTENAMLQSMYSVTFTTAVDIAIGPDPVTNLLDFMVLTTMMRLAAENNWVPVLFGPEKGTPILAAVKAAEQDVWSIADKVLTADEKRDLMLLIEDWNQQNPEQVYPWGIRMADFSGPRAARVSRVKQSGGLLREFRAARETAEEMQLFGDRVLFYMQRAPLITASVMEATTLDLLDSPDIRNLTSQSERFVVTAERLAATVGAIPAYRLAVVDQFLEGLGDERAELMGDIAAAAPATQALLVELRKTLESAERITTELSIGDRLDEPVDIAQLHALVGEATRTATEARLLVEALSVTMTDAPTLIAALDTLLLREQEIVDRTMIWLLAVIAFFFVLLIGYRLLVTRMIPSAAVLLVLLSCIAVSVQAQTIEDETAPSDLRLDLELAIEAATRACIKDIARFSSDVTPGEGRLLACLQAYKDRVSEAGDAALTQWQGPDVVAEFQTTKLYPTLEMRELREPNLD